MCKQERSRTITWRQEVCHGCGGHGVVSDYGDGEDYGPKTCPTCDGTGQLSWPELIEVEHAKRKRR